MEWQVSIEYFSLNDLGVEDHCQEPLVLLKGIEGGYWRMKYEECV